MRLLVATRSRGKQAEFRRLLAPSVAEVVFPDEVDLAEEPIEADLERFDSFEANARAKAVYFAGRSGLPALADDSGLEVDALGGGPGVHSKRFAALEGPDHEVTAANNAELLRRLASVPSAGRTARYRCVLVLAQPGGSELVASGTTEGVILEAPDGDGGFGYDPLFWSADLGTTFGRAGPEEKNRVSHRGRAVEALVRRLSD
jgi:XTP/dITP diphosphohydrolase